MQHTVIVAVPPGFDALPSNAAHGIRLGYAHAFPHVGVGAEVVPWGGLRAAAERVPGPIFSLNWDDYNHMDEATVAMLRRYPHFVYVNTWFEGMEDVHDRHGAPTPVLRGETRQRILDSEPAFVWCSASEAYRASYAGWEQAGMKVVSLPYACDTDRYYPVEGSQFAEVEAAFVGGYRRYKDPQYDVYLWPHEERLKVWGYSTWPRCYQGYLPIEDEKRLYSQARLSLTLSEPHFALTGDTVERPFKIMGCKGLTVLDLPCYRELFAEDEALIATTPREYGELVRDILEDGAPYASYRRRGYEAVCERHTYVHRARTIVQELGI